MQKQSIYLRPSKSDWWLVLVFVGLIALLWGVFVFAPPAENPREPIPWVVLLLAASALMALPIAAAAKLLTFRVEAAVDGIYSRDWRGTRFTSWTEITDYYLRQTTVQDHRVKIRKSLVLETPKGKISIPYEWKAWKGDFDAFRARVQEKATCARAPSWEQYGNRPELDWPHIFDYCGKEGQIIRRIFVVAMLIGPCLTVWLLYAKGTHIVAGPGAIYGAAMLLLMALQCNILGLRALLLIPTLHDLKLRSKESLTLTQEGLRFADAQRALCIPWNRIERLYSSPARLRGLAAPVLYVIEGDGKRIEFTKNVSESHLLSRIIALSAVNATEPKWQYLGPDTSALGGEASKWTGGYPGVGERIFRYRTREVRAFLAFGSVLTLALLIRPICEWLGAVDPLPEPMPLYLPAVLGAPILWGWWRFWAAQMVVSADGLVEYAFWGTRMLRWTEVEEYGFRGDAPFIWAKVRGRNGKNIRFWAGIANVDELTKMISDPAPQARGTWDRKSKSEGL